MKTILNIGFIFLASCAHKQVVNSDIRKPTAEFSKTISCEQVVGGGPFGSPVSKANPQQHIQLSTIEEVRSEVERGYPRLLAKGAVGQVELIANEVVSIVFRKSKLPQALERTGLFANLTGLVIFIAVKDKETGSKMWDDLYWYTSSKARVRETRQGPTVTILTRGEPHPMDKFYPPISEDVYIDLGVKSGQQVLRISFEASGVLTAREFLSVLADEGSLKMMIPTGP